jgi:hypothetical protein
VQAAGFSGFNNHLFRLRPQDPGGDRLPERAGGGDPIFASARRGFDRLEQTGTTIGHGQNPNLRPGPGLEDSGLERSRNL